MAIGLRGELALPRVVAGRGIERVDPNTTVGDRVMEVLDPCTRRSPPAGQLHEVFALDAGCQLLVGVSVAEA
jgi:hypothetical protein